VHKVHNITSIKEAKADGRLIFSE